MLGDIGQMTSSLYKGASFEVQGDQHTVKIALIFYYSIWPTIDILGEPLGQIPNNTLNICHPCANFPDLVTLENRTCADETTRHIYAEQCATPCSARHIYAEQCTTPCSARHIYAEQCVTPCSARHTVGAKIFFPLCQNATYVVRLAGST